MYQLEKRIENGKWKPLKQQGYHIWDNANKRAKSLSKFYGIVRIMNGDQVLIIYNQGKKVK